MPIAIRKLRNKNLYKVYNKETKQVHSYRTTLQKAKAQKRLIEESDHLKGGGLFQDLKKTVTKSVNSVKKNVINPIQTLANKVINGRSGFSPSINAYLAQHGNETITQMTLVRHPVNSAVVGAMGVVSNGNFTQGMKDNNIQKLYHLMLFIRTSGSYISLEKTEEIVIKYNPILASNDETLNIARVPPNTSIQQLLDRTRQRMTDNKFFGYSAYDNNCQSFILNVLLANGINDNNYNNWVKQSTEQLFQGQTGLRKLSNTVTGLASKADILMAGGGFIDLGY